MQKILVTGGAGFIGSNFIQYILKNDPNVSVINYDLLTYAGNLENLKSLECSDRYQFIQGDICDRDALNAIFRDHLIDTIVHFAAESHVDRSIIGPMPFIQTNIVGTAVLLETAREWWLNKKIVPSDQARFHHVSTDEVFGSLAPIDPPFSETTPYAPNSPYAASKASSDLLVRSYFHTYGLPITISNCSNNYGPYQFPEKLIPLIILNAKSNKPLPVYGDGKQIRDWLYVEDHCEAIHLVLTKGKAGETYNIGGNNQPTNLEIVQSICRIIDEKTDNSQNKSSASLIQFVKDRPGHDRRYAMNIRKAGTELGWSPKENLQTGLYKTVTWYLENPEWIEHIQNRPDFSSWIKQNYSKRVKKDTQ